MNIDDIQVLKIHIEKVEPHICGAVGRDKQQLWFPLKAEKLVVVNSAAVRRFHKRFRHHFRRNIFVRIFAPQAIRIHRQPALKKGFQRRFIHFRFVCNQLDAAGIMVALQNKFIRERIKIDIVKTIPGTEQREQIVLADFFPDIIAYRQLVHQLCVFRMDVVELQPVELLIKPDRIF